MVLIIASFLHRMILTTGRACPVCRNANCPRLHSVR